MDKSSEIKERFYNLIEERELNNPKDEEDEHHKDEFLRFLDSIRLEPIDDNWMQLILDCFSQPVSSFNVFLSLSYKLRFDGIEKGKSKFNYYISLKKELKKLKALLEQPFIISSFYDTNYISNDKLTKLDFIKNNNLCVKYIIRISKTDLYNLENILEKKIMKLNMLQQKIVNFNKDIQKKMFSCLKEHFNKEEHHLLERTLDGYQLKKKISFNGQLNQFVDLFSRLKKSNIIKDDSIDIKRWIVLNFTIKNKSINEKTVHEYLTKEDKGTVKYHKVICNEIKTTPK